MTTEERLENLERELTNAKRRNRWLVAVVGLVVVGLILIWTLAKTTPAVLAQAVGGAEKVIRANTFIVEDANGKVRAMLNADKVGPTLFLYDENGKTRAVLNADKEGATLLLSDENGKGGVTLSALKAGPALSLLDEKEKTRAMLALTKDGPTLDLSDENEKTRARLGMPNKGGPGLALFDENGKIRAGLGVAADGAGMVLADENGKRRAALAVDAEGPGMQLLNPEGKVIWAAGGADGVATTPRQVTPPVEAAPPAAPPPGSFICPDCHGRGMLILPSGGKRCKSCGGTGKVTSMPPRRETVEEHEAGQRALEGRPAPQWRPCPECNGSGTSTFICGFCNGTGKSGDPPAQCFFCKGRGSSPCTRCNGKGMVSD